MAYIFGSIWDRFNRNALNDLSKSVETQGKSIQDLVAKGQLTPTQYAELITVINQHVSTEELASGLEVKRDKNDKIIPQDLSEDVLSLVTGGGSISLESIPQNGSVNYGKLGTDLQRAIKENIINLYNPSLAVDGVISSYTTGEYAAFPTGASTGIIPVQNGKTYTISVPDSERGFDAAMRCFNSEKGFIGLSRQSGSYPVAPGISSGLQVVADGRKQITFSLTSNSPVRFIETSMIFPYETHSTTYFDRLRKSVQVEEGSTFTKFQLYGTSVPSIAESAMPESYNTLQNNVKQILNSEMTFIKNGNYIYIRTAWDSENDLLQKMELVKNGGYSKNEIFQFTSYGYIPKNTTEQNTLSANFTQIKSTVDDTAPFQYNGTYIGASHGAYTAININASSHGKTASDVGSEWTDSSGTKFYIIRIVDANNLWMLSENIATDGTWDFDTSISGAALTHSAGASNISVINFTGQTLNQIIPAVRNVRHTILVNGKEIDNDGMYNGSSVKIKEDYYIVSPKALLNYLISRAGTTGAWNISTLDADVKNVNTYSFENNGSCTVYNSFEFLNKVSINYYGMTQAIAFPVPSGGKLFEYIPKTLPTVAGSTTYNLKDGADVTSLSATLDVKKVNWQYQDNPPDRFIQFTESSSGNKQNGFTVGYCPEIGIGKKEVRSQLLDSAFFMPTSKKQYPRVISERNATHANNIISAGTFYEGVAFRVPINYSLYGDATNISWYKVNDATYLMIDYHTNANKHLQLPDEFINKGIEVIEKSSGFNLLSSFVNADGIRFKVSGGYGYAVLKIK